jgi:alpha-1,2-mannosyltransferase
VRLVADRVLGAKRAAPAPLPRWLLTPGAAVFLASVAAFALTARVIPLTGFDMSIYLLGGDAYRHGLDVYAQQSQGWPFTYPPVTVLLFAPLSIPPAGLVLKASVVLNVVAVGLVVWLVFRMLGYRSGAGLLGATLGLTGGAIWLQPIFDTLGQGQVNIVLMLLVVADFALARRRGWPTGVLVGVAAAVKLVPGLFIVYLLVTRRYRAAATAAGTFVVLTALGFVAAWSDSTEFWFHGVFNDSARAAGPDGVASAYNQSLHGALVRLLGSGAGNPAWYLLALVVAVLGLAVAAAASRAGDEAAGVIACALTALLVSPLSWHEHWVWVVPVLVWLIDLARRVQSWAPILAPALPCLVWLGFLLWPMPGAQPGQLVPDSPLSSLHHAWAQGRHSLPIALAATEYADIAVLLLLGCGWLYWRRRRPADTPAGSTGAGENSGAVPRPAGAWVSGG